MPMSSDALAVVLMSGLLHPTVKRSDALAKLSVARAAFNAEIIGCTLAVV